jgi:hypothetical protein
MSGLFSNTSITGATVLRLIEVASRYVFQLVHIVCAFPRLQTLSISVENGPRPNNTSLTTGCLSPHLVALELEGVCMDGMLQWIMSLPTCPALRTVYLHPFFFSDDIWIKFLLCLEDSLEFLFLSGMLSIFVNWTNMTNETRTLSAN